MKRVEQYTNKELAEAHIIPAKVTAKEAKAADKEFSVFRRRRASAMKPDEKLYGRLLQLKYLMEDYASSTSYNDNTTFSYFLGEYIHSLHIGKTDFSKEISVHHTKLSRLLNNREEPNERILVRLELHSNNTIPAITWYKVLEKQRELHLIRAHELRNSEKKHVKETARI